jgi:O-6-methylguanine DNA methyltransferase
MRRSSPPVACTLLPSPIGPLYVAFTERGLSRLDFGSATAWDAMANALPGKPRHVEVEEHPLARQLAEELEVYFEGRNPPFRTPLDLRSGTEFQQQVWATLREIPFGETRSYMDIACRIGNPPAVRAVGQAVGANPVGIVIPCHRVIGSSGKLTGFGSGLALKRRLLEHEGAL